MKKFESIEAKAKSLMQKNKSSHGWDHTERVMNLSLHIAKIEGADLDIVHVAALLHDIGRHKEDEALGEVCHAEEGAKMAAKILRDEAFDEETIAQIVHCIENHRFRGNKKPDTLEAKVLFDADKLDSIGAVGIGRAFMFAAEVGARVHNSPTVDISKTEPYGEEDTAYREFFHKLKKVHERMLTAEGKLLADERHKFMCDFFDRLNKEAAGKL